MVASGGFYLLQACNMRAMTSRSHLMVHEASVGRGGRGGPREMTADLEAIQSVNDAMSVHQCRHMTMSLEDCRARYAGRDWWILPDEAMAVGAVDVIVDNPAVFVAVLADTIGPRP
jgi:ATP-dependent protease ClpP protease subunit